MDWYRPHGGRKGVAKVDQSSRIDPERVRHPQPKEVKKKNRTGVRMAVRLLVHHMVSH